MKIIKHGATRWLSLEKALTRLLEQWIPLRKFFVEECKDHPDASSSDRKVRAKKKLNSSLTRLVCYFLQSVLPVFNQANVLLQSEKPMVHQLKPTLMGLLRKLLIRFMKPSAMSSCSELDVKYALSYNILPDKDIMIGSSALEYMSQSKGLSDDDKKSSIVMFANIISMLVTT
ncbi:uncharacterized protein LOC141910165 [Tubulanus polymorphus]|uniref:uncharacterized protein LOC141910165 n=1 Tax=Tubulanus polymorphus TaxID=672921 RepID=UPI003DA55EFC